MNDTPTPRRLYLQGEIPRPKGGLAQLADAVSVLLWLGTLAGCGGAFLGLLLASGAPLQAAVLGFAVIPYCAARAWVGMRGPAR